MGPNRVSLNLPKVIKMNINCELLKVSKMPYFVSPVYIYVSSHEEARNIEFGQQVNIFESAPLGTPPQVIVVSLAYNDVTNLFISSYSGYCYQIWVVKPAL